MSSDILRELEGRNYAGATKLAAAVFKLRAATYDGDEYSETTVKATGAVTVGKPAVYFGYDPHRKKPGKLSPSWLASSLLHATVRLDQRNANHYRWGKDGTQGGLINDAEAYQAELDNAARLGLPSEELAEVWRRYRKAVGLLRPPYRAQAEKRDFSVPDLYLNPNPSPAGHPEQLEKEKAAKLAALRGSRSFPSLEAAAGWAGIEAYSRTRKSALEPAARYEHGAFIFRLAKAYWVPPLTAGHSSQGGGAKVQLDEAMVDLLRHVATAGLKPSDIVVTGFVHSHPSLPGFQAALDPDIRTHDRLVQMKTWMNSGGVPMEYEKSFIWGPKDARIGGLDDKGVLYTWPKGR